MNRKRSVSVIGGSTCSGAEAASAEHAGRMLAENELVLVCGGGGGVMEAACKGAQAVGGITIGLLPGQDIKQGNRYLSIAIPTGLGHARNALVAQAGEVVLAIGGSTGTLSEIALAKWYSETCDKKLYYKGHIKSISSYPIGSKYMDYRFYWCVYRITINYI